MRSAFGPTTWTLAGYCHDCAVGKLRDALVYAGYVTTSAKPGHALVITEPRAVRVVKDHSDGTIMHRLNDRPRKSLGFLTPDEVFYERKRLTGLQNRI
jgi:hypothetical protein